MIHTVQTALIRANRLAAMLLGVGLVVIVLFILIDVTLRKLSVGSLGGSDEVSGYVMAAVASWGLACALIERAHVRIDLIRLRLREGGQALIDIFAMIVTNAVVLLIAYHCWPVLEKSLERGSRANTPLETPLWIPQGIWFGGWVWFALTATLLTLIGIAHFTAGRRADLDAILGTGTETER